jgi:HK97 gp10 family phage protein
VTLGWRTRCARVASRARGACPHRAPWLRERPLIELRLNGLPELLEQLDELGTVTGARALRTAARKAFGPVLEAAKSKVPVGEGDLRDSLKISVRKGGNSGEDEDVVFRVGIKVGKVPGAAGGSKVAPSRRWHLVELGTVKMPAKPYLRPALDSQRDAVLSMLTEELAKSIARVKKRRARS